MRECARLFAQRAPASVRVHVSGHFCSIVRETVPRCLVHLCPILTPLFGTLLNRASFLVSHSKSRPSLHFALPQVIQDTMMDWIDTGKLHKASTAALALSKDAFQTFYKNFHFYADKIILRCVCVCVFFLCVGGGGGGGAQKKKKNKKKKN